MNLEAGRLDMNMQEKSIRRAGLRSLVTYLPGEPCDRFDPKRLAAYLRAETMLPSEYIDTIEHEGKQPGHSLTNEEGWTSQPWFEKWKEQLPNRWKDDPFMGVARRPQVPLDPLSLRESIHPHPMLPSDAQTLAGAMALLQSRVRRDDVDLILTGELPGDDVMFPNAAIVSSKLKLKVGGWSVAGSCPTFLGLLETAFAMVSSGRKRCVLVVMSQLLRSYLNDSSQYIQAPLGDAACAAIVTCDEEGGLLESSQMSDGDVWYSLFCEIRPPSLFTAPRLGDPHVQPLMTTRKPDAFVDLRGFTRGAVRGVVEDVMQLAGVSPQDVGFLATPNPGGGIADAYREDAGIPSDRFMQTIEELGHSGSVICAEHMIRAVRQQIVGANDLVLIACPGSGLYAHAMLYRLSGRLAETLRREA